MSRPLLALPLAALLAVHAEAENAPTLGQQTYERLCENCHGPQGKGDGPAGLSALPMPRDFSVGQFKFDADSDGQTGSDADLFLVIRDGAGAAGGSPLMAPWGQLGPESIRELVVYIRSLERAD